MLAMWPRASTSPRKTVISATAAATAASPTGPPTHGDDAPAATNGRSAAHDLTRKEKQQGTRPGDAFMRVTTHPDFRRARAGHIVAREGVDAPRGGLARAVTGVKRFLFGRPIRTEDEPHERVNVFTGLAVFASDNISSSAYATEEIMRVLLLAGVGTMAALTLPITLAIIVVLAVVVVSYQQTIRAYPNGGGSYIVASDNLGPFPGLTAAAAP